MDKIFLQIILFLYQNTGFQNLGITIIELAVLSRLLLYPITRQQLKTSQKMRQLQPEVDKLKQKHKDDKQAQSQAQMALFQKHGINPAAGCLPAIIQIVVLIGLLGALNEILKMQLNTQFLLWDMSKPDTVKINNVPFLLPGILVFLAAATQYLQMKQMFPQAPKIRKDDKKPEVAEKTDFMQSFAEAQSSTLWMFPLLLVFFGTQWPSGLALYWTTTGVIAIGSNLLGKVFTKK